MDEFQLEMFITSMYEKYDEGQPYDLSERQIKNIALKLLEYDLEERDFVEAFEYTIKMKKEANFFKTCCMREYNPKWNPYFAIGYYIKRVLVTMGLSEEEYNPILFNNNLEDRLSNVEDEIRLNNICKLKRSM